jgi:hypothetical protein
MCAECGTELMLTPSGHPFCADPTCSEGFGTDILRQLFGGSLDSTAINLDRKHSRHE